MSESNHMLADRRPVLLFPGALGDFLCLLPAALSLTQCHGAVRLLARSQWLTLLADPRVESVSIDQRAVAELFHADAPLSPEAQRLFATSSVVHSWTGFGDDRFAARLQAAAGTAAVHVHAFRGMSASEHAIDYYARCVGTVAGPLPRQCLRADPHRAAQLGTSLRDSQWLLMHPGSGGRSKNWRGFAQLAAWWRRHHGPVVVLLGPAEIERGVGDLRGDIEVKEPTLPEVVALLAAAPYYAGNDSGISHLAALSGASGVALFGPSDPAVWAPRSPQLQVLHAATVCARCGPEVFCEHRLSVETVAAALTSAARAVS